MAPVRRSEPPIAARPTREERYRWGKRLRQKVPRSSQAIWSPARDRPDPLELLARSDRRRVAELLPIRYGRMSLNPFAFLRGAADVMASDLASTPTTGLRVQLGGDAHLSNFGIFGTPERHEVFDLNDFDETLPGPWEWDVKRLATSFVAGGRAHALAPADCHRAALRAARSYRESMNSYAFERYLDIWYSHLDPEQVSAQVRRGARRVIGRLARRARGRTVLHVFPKVVRKVGGGYRIRDVPPLIVHYPGRWRQEITHVLIQRYLATIPEDRRMLLERYRIADVAQKVVGVGSVGTRCSVILLVGDRDTDDPVLLQSKQALPSALEPYAGPSTYANHGQRVVVGQHLIQQSSDSFLGWGSIRSEDFYVRQLRDWKFFPDLDSMAPREWLGHAELCGAALARAHARTGDPAAISGYLGTKGTFEEAIARFAEAYADQTQRDYAEMMAAIRHGRLPARRGA